MANPHEEVVQHKKRFGQFFSGKKVANTLFSLLPSERTWKTVVDPMAGLGDLLLSVTKHNQTPRLLVGIEIDAEIARQCKERIPNAAIVCEDAFKSSTLITNEGWDLVITNPPYVRYQLLGENDEVMPSGQEIRKNLIKQLEAIQYLPKTEKDFFLSLARNYSGLSDMAVPSWILCSALVKKDGYLAIVVPETWLNRDYASPIQYLLNKCFEIETIARDTNAKWFPEALVKTSLVVAKRRSMRSILETKNCYTIVIENNKKSKQQTLSLFPYMLSMNTRQKWIRPEDLELTENKDRLPYELSNLLNGENGYQFMHLSDLGIECGQGLRTGANEFFYLSILKNNNSLFHVRSKTWDNSGTEYRFTKNEFIPALQTRNDIKGLLVSTEKLSSGVLYISGQPDTSLEKYIKSAEQYRDIKGRAFREYSAVKPNEKQSQGQTIRHWFMLPKLTNRHVPNLCVTRVSTTEPECLFVMQKKDSPIIVDANFVTLWSNNDIVNQSVFALLNSTWSKLFLELICTVMGGGALKIEASHLRKLLFPKLSSTQMSELNKAGEQLIAEGNITPLLQDKIDRIVFSPFGNENNIRKARNLLYQKKKERSAR